MTLLTVEPSNFVFKVENTLAICGLGRQVKRLLVNIVERFDSVFLEVTRGLNELAFKLGFFILLSDQIVGRRVKTVFDEGKELKVVSVKLHNSKKFILHDLIGLTEHV